MLESFILIPDDVLIQGQINRQLLSHCLFAEMGKLREREMTCSRLQRYSRQQNYFSSRTLVIFFFK